MLPGTLSASSLGIILAGKGMNRAEEGAIRAGDGAARERSKGIAKRQGRGIARACYGFTIKSNNF